MAQYLSGMKVSVSVNLLAGAWIWLHGQSDEVRRQVEGKLGNVVGVLEEGGGDVREGVDRIIAAAEDSIRRTSVWGFGVAAFATTLILFVAFFVNHDYAINEVGPWVSALVLAVTGPLTMLITYMLIYIHKKKAVGRTNDLTNAKAGGLIKQESRKPPTVPTIGDSP